MEGVYFMDILFCGEYFFKTFCKVNNPVFGKLFSELLSKQQTNVIKLSGEKNLNPHYSLYV